MQQLLQPASGGQQKVVVTQAVQNQPKLLLNQAVVQSGAKQIIIKQPQKIVLSPGQRIVTTTTNQSPQLLNNKQIMIGNQNILIGHGQSILTQTLQQQTNVQTTSMQQQQQQQQVQQQQVYQEKPTAAMVQKPIMVTAGQTPIAKILPNTGQRTQIIVQNQTLAQQISSGKVQIANINGQQVLIRQTGNNQAIVVAHIKQQNEGPAQVVPVQTQMTAATTATVAPQQTQQILSPPQPSISIQPTPIQSAVPQQTLSVATSSSSSSSSDLAPAMEQALLKGQPPGTVIKCVTAQVIQTTHGPRIVLQGLQGADFTQQQSALVQQQVKQQLLKGKRARF